MSEWENKPFEKSEKLENATIKNSAFNQKYIQMNKLKLAWTIKKDWLIKKLILGPSLILFLVFLIVWKTLLENNQSGLAGGFLGGLLVFLFVFWITSIIFSFYEKNSCEVLKIKDENFKKQVGSLLKINVVFAFIFPLVSYCITIFLLVKINQILNPKLIKNKF